MAHELAGLNVHKYEEVSRAIMHNIIGKPVFTFTFNLQATKLFIATSATKGVVTPFRFRVRFKILYRVIYPLIQHCLLHKMVYLNIIYVIATRNYEFFTTGIFP